MILSETDRQAIRELELSGFKVAVGDDHLLLCAGVFSDVPAMLRHLLHHGIRFGASPACPDCETGSCGLSDGAPGVGEAISGAPSLRLVGS